MLKHAPKFLLVIWLLGISFAVLYLLFKSDTPKTAGNINTCNLQETLKKAKQNTLRIDREDGGHGTGFIVGKDGYIATNNHVIEGAKAFTVYSPYWSQNMQALNPSLIGDSVGNKHARVIISNSDLDIAIIKIDDVDVDPIPFSKSQKDINLAENLFVVGWPNEKIFSSVITSGIYSGSILLTNEKKKSQFFIQTDAPINPGNSGGPIVDKCGVVGMVTSKLSWTIADEPIAVEGVGYAIPIDDIKDFFNKNRK